MKVKAVKKLHPTTFTNLNLSLNQWILVNLFYLKHELPDDYRSALLDISPSLFTDASLLNQRLETVQPDKAAMLNDAEMYTLYIAYDILGRLLASSWRDRVVNGFREEAEKLPATKVEKLYRYALATIGPTLKETEKYARREKCLKQLPEIKRNLRQLPDLD